MDKKTHYNSIHKECRVMILCEGPNLTKTLHITQHI